MDSTGMLDNTVRLVAAARAAGATIMHAPITFATGYNEISAHPYGILKGVVDGNAFVKDSWGAAIVDVLAPQTGDIVVEGKRGLDTFASTNLDFILRSKGITTIVLGGFLTNCCVESTMRTGYENGYSVFTLKDCVAATSQAEHDNAITYDFPMFSMPVSAETVIAALSPSASDALRLWPTRKGPDGGLIGRPQTRGRELPIRWSAPLTLGAQVHGQVY
jgi:nicotinamidase-related amidase